MNITEELKLEQQRLERALAGIRVLIEFYESDQRGHSAQDVYAKGDERINNGILSCDGETPVLKPKKIIDAVESLIPALPDSFTTTRVVEQLRQTRSDEIKPATVTAALLTLVKRKQIELEIPGKGQTPHTFRKIAHNIDSAM